MNKIKNQLNIKKAIYNMTAMLLMTVFTTNVIFAQGQTGGGGNGGGGARQIENCNCYGHGDCKTNPEQKMFMQN